MECMAASDNVVRSGLTPKYIDTETLCSMLTYDFPEIGGEDRKKVNPTSLENGLLYTPGTPDFTVAKFTVNTNSSIVLPVCDGPSILLVVDGKKGKFEAKNESMEVYNNGGLHRGMSLFMGAKDVLEITSGTDQLEIFLAFC